MVKMTWGEVIEELIKLGAPDFCEQSEILDESRAWELRAVGLGRLMQEVAHQTIAEGGDPCGDVFPGMDDEVPEWVLKEVGIVI